MDGQTALAVLANMPRRRKCKSARLLIFKKATRPRNLDDQVVLLDALSQDQTLTRFDRNYAVIAAGHKICELVDVEGSKTWVDRMRAEWSEIAAMPIGYGLRKDRTHLVFSWLNVAMNLDLMRGGDQAGVWADATISEIDALNPRQMTPYLFNSNSNIIKVIGLSILKRPEQLDRLFDLALRLESYGIEINNPVFWWVFSRFQSPERISQVDTRAAFTSHRKSMRRLDAIEHATKAKDAGTRHQALLRVADLCVAQANDNQKQALLNVVQTKILAL